MVDIWGKTRYDQAALTAASEAGLIVRDVPREVAGDSTAGQHVDYVALPY
jgi:hypothetical protein